MRENYLLTKKILIVTCALALFVFPYFAKAGPCEANICWPDPQIKISDSLEQKLEKPPVCSVVDGKQVCTNTWLADYIAEIYKYAISIVGILSTVVMMIGGFVWITSGGSASRVGEAKAWIGGALTGLVLTLSSYMILYQINSNTTNIKPLTIGSIDKMPKCCNQNGPYTAKQVEKNGTITTQCDKPEDVCEEPNECIKVKNKYECTTVTSGCCSVSWGVGFSPTWSFNITQTCQDGKSYMSPSDCSKYCKSFPINCAYWWWYPNTECNEEFKCKLY